MKSASAIASPTSFLASGGEMVRRIREFDWTRHPLGPPGDWPQSLKVVVRIMLTSRFAMWLGWGPEFYFFCNDAYAPTLGLKRDAALGDSARRVWAEIWNDIGPRAESVVRTGEATWDESLMLFLERSGYPEETYHTFSYSPVPHDDGSIGGMLCVVTEETERVIGARRLALLRRLGADLAAIKVEEELFRAVTVRLGERAQDLPFALIYLLAPDGESVRLACAHRATAGSPMAPTEIRLEEKDSVWPAAALFAQGEAMPIDDLARRFASVPAEPWDKPPRGALLVPIAEQGQERPAGFLVAGLNPYRPLDAAYRGFLDLLAGQIAAGLASARAYETERRRAEALAEIDRAKTAFFSNVSHEFRTPLTLLLGPLQEILEKPEGEIRADHRHLAMVAHRNALRLLKLVNSLLDFSRLEAGRARAHFGPTDLAAYTAELASSFRSAMEKAGLELVVECAPLPEPVHVDREMWEKIVLNLLSNAFKFTLHGEVRVTVRAVGDSAEIAVRDTGTGIPDEAMTHLFERFYRVQGARGRTHEGSGIGLALVHELVKLHGGAVRAESALGHGSAFIVTLPFGTAHLPADQLAVAPVAGTPGTAAFLAEALRWLPDDAPPRDLSIEEGEDASALIPSGAPRPRILLADDNADMRDYIARLLSSRFDVVAVADGRAALEAALDEHPDLVLTDVMMPRLDGFGLLREMRADAALQAVPIILLSARAGEESRVEGLEAGADDYLIKPFHARELLAKISGTLRLSRLRAEAAEREANLRAERTEILESMNLAFMAMDADFRIIYLNAEAGRAYGMTPEKYLGRSHWEAFPDSVGTLIETNYRRAMSERVALHFENFYESWQQWFEINAYPMTDGQLGVFFREITESKRLQEELRRSESLYRAIGESIDYGVWVCTPDGRNTYASPSFLQLLGITQEECSDFGWGDRLSPDETAHTIAAWKECVSTGGNWDREHSFRGADGERKSILARGVPVRDERGQIQCWAGINLDISRLKEIEEALRTSEAKFRQIADTMPQMVWVTDPEGKPEYFNQRWYEFGGFVDGSLGPWKGLLHPEDEDRVRAQWRRNLESGEQYEIEYRLRRHDGQHCWFLCRALPVHDDSGRIVHWFGTCTDIDEFKRFEAALREAKEQAELANQSKDRFLAVLSHELRTPLTPVLMAVAALEHDPALSPHVREDLAMMKRNIELETKLIDDLLDLNRITSGKLALNIEPLHLNEAVRHVCGICHSQLDERGMSLEIDLDETAGTVAADPARLRQVLWNVLKNAIKFTPAKGVIRVSTRRLADSRCEVRVQDSGVGIPAEVLPRIFDAFEQGDASVTRQFGGMGLGLAICKALIDLHHGSIRAESPGAGHGSTFVVDLLAAAYVARAQSTDAATATDGGARPIRLLVVEDHADTARTLTRLLNRAGFLVTTAADVASATANAERDDFDVLVSDLGLPDGDGFEVLRRLSIHRRVPAIAMSGYGMDDDVRRSREAGFAEHLVKPIEVPQLIAAIRRVTEFSPPPDGAARRES